MTAEPELVLTSARTTLQSFFRRVLALFRAFLLFSTGTLIMGVLMLELATIRISLRLWVDKQEGKKSSRWLWINRQCFVVQIRGIWIWWGAVTEGFPKWRSSLLCRRSGRCWGSSEWRARRWTELPADPQLHPGHTENAATYSAAAAGGWGHRNDYLLSFRKKEGLIWRGTKHNMLHLYYLLFGGIS